MKIILRTALAALIATSGVVRAATSFEIDEYRVEGNTVLDDDTINDALYPFLGPDRTAADVEKARAALTALYAARGYSTVFAQVPRQKVTDGVIVINVVERHVGRLRITGSHYFALDKIRQQAPSLAEGVVPNIADIKRDIIALNQWPDRTITPILKAGSTPDTVDVELQVKDKPPVHASLEWNDRQSENTTRTRLQASVSYDNLWQRGDTISASFQAAPLRLKDSEVFTIAYQYRLPNSDRSLTLSYLHSGSDISTVGSSSVIGKGNDVGLRYNIPLMAKVGFDSSFSTGIDYKRFYQIVPGSEASFNTPITYVPLNLAYEADWSSKSSTTTIAPSITLGLSSLSNNAAQFGVSRNDAYSDFFDLKLDATRTQALPWGTQLYVHVSGQEAMEPLVSNEQFGIGGGDSVRGYLESEALGDAGVFNQIELRSPDLKKPKLGLDQLRLFAYYDNGKVWLRDALPAERADTQLSSAGIGLRSTLLTYLSAELEGGQVLTTGPYSHAGDRRFLFRLIGGF